MQKALHVRNLTEIVKLNDLFNEGWEILSITPYREEALMVAILEKDAQGKYLY